MSSSFACNTLLPHSTTLENLTFVDVDTNGEAGEGTVIFCIQQDTSYQNPIACTSYFTYVEETDAKNTISLFPNPAEDILYIEWSAAKYTGVTIYNSQGVKVSEQRIGSQKQLQISTEFLASGVYVIALYDGTIYVTERFVKI